MFDYTKMYDYAIIISKNRYQIEKIIVNGPATIVFWNDGTKTVVKRSDALEAGLFDIHAAVAQALAKKIYGSTSHFHKIVDKKST